MPSLWRLCGKNFQATQVQLQLSYKLQATQGSNNKSKALWDEAPSYYKINSTPTYSPIMSVLRHVDIGI